MCAAGLSCRAGSLSPLQFGGAQTCACGVCVCVCFLRLPLCAVPLIQPGMKNHNPPVKSAARHLLPIRRIYFVSFFSLSLRNIYKRTCVTRRATEGQDPLASLTSHCFFCSKAARRRPLPLAELLERLPQCHGASVKLTLIRLA